MPNPMTDGPWKTFRIDEHPDYEALPKDRCTLTMLQGPAPGAIQPVLGQEFVMGRGEDLDSRIDDRGMSRRHARVFQLLGQWCVEDLGSTNGTRLNGAPVIRPMRLSDGDRIQVGETTVLKVSLMDATEAAASRKLYESAVRDPLTGAHNRGHFDERLQSEFAFAKRHSAALSVVLLDLDHFKSVNDTHGHQAGDHVLVTMAQVAMQTVRQEDVFARYGGEEFVVLTRLDAPHTQSFAERLRKAIGAMVVEWEGTHIPVTASVGVATHDVATPYDHAEQLLAASDRAVYRAKNEGRNRVCVA